MNNEQTNEISSVQLTPYSAVVKGELNVGSFIVNDYVINIIEEDDGYSLEIRKGSQVQVATINNAISIDSVFLVDSSQESGGKNTIRLVLSNGEFEDFDFYNGEKGNKGDPGLTYRERQDILEAEAQRISAENQRISAEEERESNEETRVLNETMRINSEAERVSKEKNRVSAESTRIGNENARQGAESVREYNENQRKNAEDNRVAEWVSLKGEFNNTKSQIMDIADDVAELSDQVGAAARDVVEAYDMVNRHIEASENLIEEVEDVSEDLRNMTTLAEILPAGFDATASYVDGVLTIGVPRGADGEDGTDGVGVPTGGTTGQVLTKASGTNYDTEWTTPNPVVTVTGTTPTITALPGIRYVCGEVITLDITLPALGIVDVTFESGSTPTVLTITPPTGVTVKWTNGFDPTALEADTTYEIRIRDGHLASALKWV